MTKHDEAFRNEFSAMLDRYSDNIAAYVKQIESGEYGEEWTVSDGDGDELGTAVADNAEDAVSAYVALEASDGADTDDWTAERIEADEPTVNETSISEYPLEVIDERGRLFTVLLTTGGPHIEVTADGLRSAKLDGYWGGEHITRSGAHLSTFLDYFIDRD